MAAGYTGFQDHPREEEHRNYHAYNAYDAYTAGLSEEEQLERAVRASLRDQGGSSLPSLTLKQASRGEAVCKRTD